MILHINTQSHYRIGCCQRKLFCVQVANDGCSLVSELTLVVSCSSQIVNKLFLSKDAKIPTTKCIAVATSAMDIVL